MLKEPSVMSSLISLSRLPVFSTDFALAFKDNLELLRCLKQLKYFWSIPQSQLTILLKQIAVEIKGTSSQEAATLESFQKESADIGPSSSRKRRREVHRKCRVFGDRRSTCSLS